MTHAPYDSGGRVFSHSDRHDCLVEQGLELWERHAEYYRTLPMRYVIISRVINNGNIKSTVTRRRAYIKVMPDRLLRQYKRILLFEYWNRDDARGYLDSLSTSELEDLLWTIRHIFADDYIYNQVKNRVQEGNSLLYRSTHQYYA